MLSQEVEEVESSPRREGQTPKGGRTVVVTANNPSLNQAKKNQTPKIANTENIEAQDREHFESNK
eukprot:507961-Rhodomonas_salina.1